MLYHILHCTKGVNRKVSWLFFLFPLQAPALFNSQSTTLEEHPYLYFIEGYCNAFLVAPDMVVTADHCNGRPRSWTDENTSLEVVATYRANPLRNRRSWLDTATDVKLHKLRDRQNGPYLPIYRGSFQDLRENMDRIRLVTDLRGVEIISHSRQYFLSANIRIHRYPYSFIYNSLPGYSHTAPYTGFAVQPGCCIEGGDSGAALQASVHGTWYAIGVVSGAWYFGNLIDTARDATWIRPTAALFRDNGIADIKHYSDPYRLGEFVARHYKFPFSIGGGDQHPVRLKSQGGDENCLTVSQIGEAAVGAALLTENCSNIEDQKWLIKRSLQMGYMGIGRDSRGNPVFNADIYVESVRYPGYCISYIDERPALAKCQEERSQLYKTTLNSDPNTFKLHNHDQRSAFVFPNVCQGMATDSLQIDRIPFVIKIFETTTCLVPLNNLVSEENSINLASCDNDDAHFWTYEQRTGFLRNKVNPSLCLTISDSGANLQSCSISNNMQKFEAVYDVHNRLLLRSKSQSSMTISAAGSNDGAALMLSAVVPSNLQFFEVDNEPAIDAEITADVTEGVPSSAMCPPTISYMMTTSLEPSPMLTTASVEATTTHPEVSPTSPSMAQSVTASESPSYSLASSLEPSPMLTTASVEATTTHPEVSPTSPSMAQSVTASESPSYSLASSLDPSLMLTTISVEATTTHPEVSPTSPSMAQSVLVNELVTTTELQTSVMATHNGAGRLTSSLSSASVIFVYLYWKVMLD